MVDILIFVYENFFSAGIYPSRTVLAERLYAAGFQANEVDGTLNWLASLEIQTHPEKNPVTCINNFPEDWNRPIGNRYFGPSELEHLQPEGWQFLACLENSGVLSPIQRELILSGLLTSEWDEPDIENIKLMTLMVLWRQGDSPSALLIEELIHLDYTPIH